MVPVEQSSLLVNVRGEKNARCLCNSTGATFRFDKITDIALDFQIWYFSFVILKEK